MTQPQPKTMELLRNRYCICSCCCAGQCRSECPWCTREIHCCACGTSPEDRENPCQPCSPDCRHLNCNPEEAERTERQMDQLLRKVLRLPESWDSHEGSKIQGNSRQRSEDNSRHRDATGTPNAMDRSRRRRRHRTPVGNEQRRTLHRHSTRPGDHLRTERGRQDRRGNADIRQHPGGTQTTQSHRPSFTSTAGHCKSNIPRENCATPESDERLAK